MSADTKQSRMNRALIWTFLWVLWLGGGLKNRMLVPGAPYFWLNLLITLAGVVFVGFHWYRYLTFKEDKTGGK